MLGVAALTLGLPEGATFAVARRQRGLRLPVALAMLLLLSVGIAGCLVIGMLADLLSGGDPALAAMIVLASCAMAPALLVSLVRGVFAGLLDWSRIAWERTLASVLRLVGVAALAVVGELTPLSATLVIAASTFLGGVVYLIPARRREISHGPLLHEPIHPKATLPGLLGYAIRHWFGGLAGVVLMRVDQVLMTPLSSVSELGLYAIAVSVSEVVLVFNSAVREVIFASQASSVDMTRAATAARVSTLVTIFVSIGVAAMSPLVFPILFGTQFSDAVPVTWVLLLAIVVGNPGSVAGSLLAARNRPEARSASIVVGAAMNVVLVFALVPQLGAIGAAAATFAGNAIAGTMNVIWLRALFKVPPSEYYLLRVDDIRTTVTALRRMLRI